jgi:ABC-2 type transport system permease protein
VAGHDLALLRRDPWPVVALMVMPFLLMLFVTPLSRDALIERGYRAVNGTEQSVPGITILFAYFLVSTAGISILREHAWGTWDRLRATPLRSPELIVAKALVPVAVLMFQMSVLFAAANLVLGLRARGSAFALLPVAAALAVCLVSLGMALVTVVRSLQQLTSGVNLLALVSGGLCGAFAPVADFPAWARLLARLTPGYWAMTGSQAVLLEHGGIGAVTVPTAVLLLFALLFTSVAAVRLRVADTKNAFS